MAARILLTTTVHWPSAARLIGAFANAGAAVDALLPAGHIAAHSRYLKRRHFHDPLFPELGLVRAITESQPDLLIAGDDRALAQALRLEGRFPDLIARSFGRAVSYQTIVSRSAFIAAAHDLAIAAPESLAIESESDLQQGLASLGFPAVLKIDGMWGGDGVAVLHSPAQAAEAWRRLAVPPSRLRSVARAVLRRDAHFLREAVHKPRRAVSLQRFVPGTAATTAFACWKGRVLATLHMDVLETMHTRGPASVLKRVDDPDMEHAAIQLAEHFELSGLHGLDFVRDGAGKAQLVEMNPRATQTCALALGPGRDLAAALVACVSPGLKERPALTANPLIALFPQEWRRDPASPWLHQAYPDVPWDDEAVLRACLEPGETSPDRRRRSTALTLRQAIGP